MQFDAYARVSHDTVDNTSQLEPLQVEKNRPRLDTRESDGDVHRSESRSTKINKRVCTLVACARKVL